MRIGILAALTLVLAACSPPSATTATSSAAETETSADDVVRALYAPYLAGGDTPAWFVAAPMTAELRALYNRANSANAGDAIIDADPIIAAQDFQLSDLAVSLEAPPAHGRAVVTARFKNMGADSQVHYDMIENGGAWQIDNIRSGESDLRAELLATISAP